MSDSISYLSVSRIKTYQECSEKYKNKYVSGIPDSGTSKSTLIGSLIHEALEEYYLNNHISVEEAFYISSPTTLSSKAFNGQELKESFINLLKSYSAGSVSLHKRASEDYQGKDAIRTKDGRVPTAPQMTSSWKSGYISLGLEALGNKINIEACTINIDLMDLDIAEIYTEALFLCTRFQEPDTTIKTLHVEFPISDVRREGRLINAVLLPEQYGGSESKYLNGYIDKVALINHEGEEGIAIIDFKSGGEFTLNDIKYNPQLYSYVYAYEKITGEEVKFIGIHNLRKGNQVTVRVDRNIMNTVLDNLFSTHTLISAGLFRKHLPDSKYSKCLNSYGKPCPYLSVCWPDFVA
jgi:hypothetical protein